LARVTSFTVPERELGAAVKNPGERRAKLPARVVVG